MLTWTQTNRSTVQLADSHHLVFLSLLANIHSSPHTPVFQAAPEHCWSNPLWSMITSPRGFSLGWPSPPPPPPPTALAESWTCLGYCPVQQAAPQTTDLVVKCPLKQVNPIDVTKPFPYLHNTFFLEQHPPPPPHQVLQNTIHLRNNYNLNNFFLLSPSLPSM